MWTLSLDNLFDAVDHLFDAAQRAVANASVTEVLVFVAVVSAYVMVRALRL